ncbi:MAG: PAS domain S-box protein [bacterium]|nr:PAS domain S-box protein [bacterium]
MISRPDGEFERRLGLAYLAASLLTGLLGCLVFIVMMQIVDSETLTAGGLRLISGQKIVLTNFTLIENSLTSAAQQDFAQQDDTRLLWFLDSAQTLSADLQMMQVQNTLPSAINALYFAPNGIADTLAQVIALTHVLLADETAYTAQLPNVRRLYELTALLDAQFTRINDLYLTHEDRYIRQLRLLAFVVLFGLISVLTFEWVVIFRPMRQALRRRNQRIRAEIAQREQTEYALRQSETLYRRLVHQLPDMAVILFDTQQRITLADGPFLKAVQLADGSIEGALIREVLPKEAYEVLSPHYLAALRGEKSELERTYGPYTYYARFLPLYDSENKISGGMIVVQDTSARKQAEAATRSSEERFRNISEIMSDYTYGIEVDADGTLRNVWKAGAFEPITGYTSEEFDARGGWRSVFYPEDLPIAAQRFKRLMAGQDDISEFRITTKSGEIRWLRDYGRPVWDEVQQRVTFIYGAAQDITEQKLAEARLALSEQKYRTLAENMADVVWVVDAATMQFIYISPSVETASGFTVDEMMTGGFEHVVTPEAYAMIRTLLPQRIEAFLQGDSEAVIQTHHLEQLHKDGTWAWAEMVTKVVQNHQGEVQLIGVTRDISERMRLQKLQTEQVQLQTAFEKEVELNGLKSRMMLRIAHEFRTPLSVILTSSQMLERFHDRYTPHDRSAKTRLIESEVRAITRMLDDMSLVVNGSFLPEKLWLDRRDIVSICQEVIAEVEQEFDRAFFLSSPHQVFVDQVDRALLKRGLFEVVKNAAQFSCAGTRVQITLTIQPERLEIIVHNEGDGILPNELSRVFDPFFRGSTISEIKGLGLGLTLAKAAVEAHQGTIHIDSVLHQGTRVTIALPL